MVVTGVDALEEANTKMPGVRAGDAHAHRCGGWQVRQGRKPGRERQTG
jgi:hypothetical protein